MNTPRGEVTRLLNRLGRGDRTAESELAVAIHSELRQLAVALVGRGAAAQTLQPTALVNEAWLRLLQKDELEFDARRQFFALAATIMRGIVVDHARARSRLKRAGGVLRLSIVESQQLPQAGDSADTTLDVLALEEALIHLEEVDPALVKIVVLRFYGGFSHPEIAETMGTSLSTVERNWRAARAFLTRELEP